MRQMTSYPTVTVRVPATSANLGPGFDTLGLALPIWNTLRARWGGPPAVAIHGEGSERLPTGEDNLIYASAQHLLMHYAGEPAPLRLESWQSIPLARGLGSSSSAIVAGLFAANALLGFPADLPTLLRMATEIEGHPDNVAPALAGGMTVAVRDGEQVYAAPVPVPAQFQCVLLVPDFQVPTNEARALLAEEVSREDAVFNAARAALMVAAFATEHPEYLRVATQDRLHQDARRAVFPAMKYIFRNALSAGAWGVCLSGAGPAVLAFTTKDEHRAQTIGYEMADAADKAGVSASFRILEPAQTGAQVLALGVES